MTREECIAKIENLIPSPQVRNSIFRGDELNRDEFLCTQQDILVYFSNLLNVAFLFVYSRYKKWREFDNMFDSDAPNNFVRVFDELEKIYKNTYLSFDIIENLLLDVQLDITIGGQITKELRLDNKIIKNNDFSKYAYMAKKARRSSRINYECTLQESYAYLIDLISTFPFLRDLTYTYRPIDNVYLCDEYGRVALQDVNDIVLQYDSNSISEEKEFNCDLDTNELMITKNGKFYFLEGIETHNGSDSAYLKLSYWTIGNFNQSLNLYISSAFSNLDNIKNEYWAICYDTAYEDYICSVFDFDLAETEEDEDVFRIKNFYNINYKYIKNLALSLSDVLQDNSRDLICELYGSKHNFTANRDGVIITSGKSELEYSWSEIISVLMVEEGATIILSYLLKNDKGIRGRLLSNLEFRFGSNLLSRQNVESEIAKELVALDKQMKLDNGFLEKGRSAHQREIADYQAEIEARKIIVAISKAVNGNTIKEIRPSFPISIRSKKQLLEEIKTSKLSLTLKYESVRQIVVQAFSILYRFYYGFFGYAYVRREFDNESFYRSLSNQEIEKYQKQAEEAFARHVQVVDNKLKDLEKTDVVGILKIFKDFCIRCEHNNANENYQQYLKDMLGKSKIIDISAIDNLLDYFSSISDEGMLSDEGLEDLIDQVKKVFSYLQTGKSRQSSNSLGVIFPYVATCEYTDISRDGNIVYHFTIISPKGFEQDLRVLSEFNYTLNQKYYFMPNKLSSDERLNLWIEPIIIGYENFNIEQKDTKSGE